MSLGLEAEKFGTDEAIADDKKVAEVYAAKGAEIVDLYEKTVDKWRAIARDTAWKDYARKDSAVGGVAEVSLKACTSPDAIGQHHGSRPRQRRDRKRGGVRKNGRRRL